MKVLREVRQLELGAKPLGAASGRSDFTECLGLSRESTTSSRPQLSPIK